MAAFVNPSSAAIICRDVPAKLCRVNRSTATSISRVRVSVVANAAVAIASSSIRRVCALRSYGRLLAIRKASPFTIDTMSEVESTDFFRDGKLINDPYLYLAALRSKCHVHRESHHDVVMVTGYDEALT